MYRVNRDHIVLTTKRSRHYDEEEGNYWDEEDEQEDNLAKRQKAEDEDSEEDPLDAFMAGIEKEVKTNTNKKEEKKKEKETDVRLDIEEEDNEESYYRYMKENPTAGLNAPLGDLEEQCLEDDIVEYDKDGNPIINRKKLKFIDPLPPIDHSNFKYEPFEKNFYIEHEEIQALDQQKVRELRKTIGITVTGVDPPKPCISFAHFGFDDQLMKAIIKSEYTQPTPIQCQAIPIALSGRDCLGIAKTGTGKTAAYVWPMLIHIMDQPELQVGDGPIGLILAPTRELVQQIYNETKRFAKVYGIRVICCYGGASKYQLTKDLQEGAEIVVATPGRMIDMIKSKGTNLQRVTMLVLDEADRMLDIGFGIQVKSICEHCRPDRQTLLFSATFKYKVEKLSREALIDPIKVVHGSIGVANEDVTQVVNVLPDGPSKWNWLISRLVEFTSSGSVLIFVTKKANAEELASNLKSHDFNLVLIHGDMDQIDRNKAISTFKRQEVNIMVATDVAARGLDITHIRTVINYDVARDIDTHTHRIGRTGRAGDKNGIAYTLVIDKDKEFAGHLVRNLESANQIVPQKLMDLAMQSSWFRKSRFKKGKAKRLNIGGAGLGYKNRPGLGSKSESTSSAGPSSLKNDSSNQDLNSTSMLNFDRVAAIKAAYKARFQSSFKPSSDNLSTVTPSNEDKTKKKSRWE